MDFKTIIVTTYILLGLIGCQHIEVPEKPENFIPANEMEGIIYESTLLTAAKGYNSGKLSKTGIKPETFVLEKFNIDSLTFAENMGYYATDPENFREMNARVSKRIVALHKNSDSIYKIEKAIKDSIRKCEIENGKELDTLQKPVLRKTEEIDSIEGKKDSLVNTIIGKGKKKRDSLIKPVLSSKKKKNSL